MVGWHHRLDGHEFEQAPGVGDGQGGLVCCSPWGCKESDTTEQLSLSAATLCTVACQAPGSIGFSRQEYGSGVAIPFSRDLPNPGIELISSALQVDSLPSEPLGKPLHFGKFISKKGL